MKFKKNDIVKFNKKAIKSQWKISLLKGITCGNIKTAYDDDGYCVEVTGDVLVYLKENEILPFKNEVEII